MRFPLLILALLVVISCKKKDDTDPFVVAPQGNVRMNFENVIDGQPIQFGQLAHTNPFGSPYSVSMLKYYISNVELVRNDGSVFKALNYELINEEDASSKVVDMDSVPNGTYTSIRFYVGIDSARNHTGVQDGDLDPMNGMIWTWNTGYIFFKHEGNFKDVANDTKGLIYHFGTDAALATVELPLNALVVNGNDKTMRLQFDLNDVYGSPNLVDFNDNNVHMSSSLDDIGWIKDLRENFPSSFQVVSIE